ncbi:MAG: winged helix-turn-helix transcriptional regulator [Micrococcales bacterium]|nr:winged helix-turn-helix transcriptional regulator [Micrococcales bacterium]
MIPTAPPCAQTIPVAMLFRSLADSTRLAILEVLVGGEARVADLTRMLSLAQSSVSAHVACLRECGLVVGRAEGRQVFYSLASPHLLDLLASAEILLRATGSDLDQCPNYGEAAGKNRPNARRRSGDSPPERSGDSPPERLGVDRTRWLTGAAR